VKKDKVELQELELDSELRKTALLKKNIKNI